MQSSYRSRQNDLSLIAGSLIRSIRKADEWAAGAGARPIIAKLREDAAKLAIAQARAVGRRLAIVDLEWRFRDVPGSSTALDRCRTDVVAIANKGQRLYLVAEVETGGPQRTDEGVPREYARQVLSDLQKLRNISAGKVRRVVGVLHRRPHLVGLT